MTRPFSSAPPRSPDPSADARPVPERILEAALRLVESQGLSALSQARVAQAAGLRQSHLTYYYPTRKDLLLAIVERIHARMTQTISLPDANGGPLSLGELRAFLAATVQAPLMGRLMAALMAAADEDPSLRRWLLDFDQEVLGLMRADFARFGVHPSEDDLMLFSSTMLGAVLMAAQADSPAASGRFARVIGLAFDRVVAASPRTGRKGSRP